MFSKTALWPLAACAIVATTAHTAPAGIITSFNLPSGPTIPVSTPAPNNNNTVTASPNVIDLPVAPGTALVFNNLAPTVISFSSQPSGGVTEYFVRESILNNSGVDWSGFNLVISPNTSLSGLLPAAFDNPSFDPAPTASAFSVRTNVPRVLGWSNGIVLAGQVLNLTFSIDNFDASPTTFTLTQSPVAVPEPSSFIFATFAVFAIVTVARFRARSGDLIDWDAIRAKLDPFHPDWDFIDSLGLEAGAIDRLMQLHS